MSRNEIDQWFPFPLDGSPFELPFGVKVLRPNDPLLIATESHDTELQLKREMASQSPEDYFKAWPDSHSAQVRAFSYLQSKHPQLNLDIADPQPLLSAAMQIQEDLVLMEGDWPHRLIAGAVFFPSGWSIADKIGQSLQQVHSVVPRFEQTLERQTDRLVTHLKVDRPVWRMNWGVRPSDQLDQSPKWSSMLVQYAEQIDATNAGLRCFFRVERQTLSRLPSTGEILFTIHTRQYRIGSLMKSQLKFLYQSLTTCPEDTLNYKGISAFYSPLIRFLEQEGNSD